VQRVAIIGDVEQRKGETQDVIGGLTGCEETYSECMDGRTMAW
jgi:hypothetical protein